MSNWEQFEIKNAVFKSSQFFSMFIAFKEHFQLPPIWKV